MIIRDAQPGDAEPVAQIYAPAVQDSAISFEMIAPSAEEMGKRISRASERWPWLVMEQADQLCGYAYAIPFRTREAYQYSAETTVYVDHRFRRQRVGQRLMESLIARLQSLRHHVAIAGITLPNEASVALHERLGFQPVGVFREVGRKLDSWHDVGFWQLWL